MSDLGSTPGRAKPAKLLARFFGSIVDAAHGIRFDPEPIAEMLRLIAVLSAIIGIGGIGQLFWMGNPIHDVFVFLGFLAMSAISMLRASVVYQDE